MPDFFKKNTILFTVLIAAFLTSIVLIFFVFKEYMKTGKCQAELVNQKNKVVELGKEKPAPVKGNLEALNADITLLTEKIRNLHLIFGKPNRAAIREFAAALDLDENELYQRWRSFYEKEKKGSFAEQVFLKFMGTFGEDKTAGAIAAFKSEYEKRSLEKLTASNTNQIILEGLGVQRTVSPEACKAYAQDMEKELLFLLGSSYGEGKSIVIPEKTAFFNVYGERLPLPEHIGLIVKHYRLLEDIVFRMKQNGISGIKSLSKTNLEGTEGKGFQTFTYKMEINGSLDSVRNFLNDLQNAHRENRVYVVRDLHFKRMSDDTKSLAISQPVADPNPLKHSPSSAAPSGIQTEEKNKKEENLPGYGAPLIGKNSEITADIKFDYVLYTADEIKGRR